MINDPQLESIQIKLHLTIEIKDKGRNIIKSSQKKKGTLHKKEEE